MTPLIYPPMIYLTVRMVVIGSRRQPREFQIGSGTCSPRRADVCAHRLPAAAEQSGLKRDRRRLRRRRGAATLIDGTLPYGHMPAPPASVPRSHLPATPSPMSSSTAVRVAHLQRRHLRPDRLPGLCPGVAAMGWSGYGTGSRPRTSPRRRSTSGDRRPVRGRSRLGSRRLGVALAFAWAANPFTLYSLNMNSNDAPFGALVAWTLAVLSFPVARGVLLAAAGVTKFAPLAMIPLFGSLKPPRDAGRVRGRGAAPALDARARRQRRLAALARTVDYQVGRVTPMSVWTLGITTGLVGPPPGPAHPPDRGRHRVWAWRCSRATADAAAVAAFAGAVVLIAQMMATSRSTRTCAGGWPQC